ncbi:ABC transporter permease [Microbacterium hatanonis]|uniref:ABC transporter permease n=1 Tax=Microbacterium hatanonis TaxID=404366 RepID=A0A5C8HZI7_9MICO|nr:ABC transporter permease [Microbacterium hatanonis]TXK12026.1 ABC transporter permease [Microbacterium hatanonis]
MLRYALARLLALAQVVVVMSVVVYALIYAMPGDPATVILGDDATAEQIAELRAQLGLDRPAWLGYLDWLSAVLRGDLGYSIFLRAPVAEVLGERLVPTVSIALLAAVVSLLVAVPLAVAAARTRAGAADTTLSIVATLGMAVPGFLLALLLVRVFAVQLGWFPVAGYAPPERGILPFLSYLVLPAVALGVVQISLLGRITRSSVVDVLSTSFVTVVRAKGVSSSGVLYGHALRNALVPIVTVLAGSFGSLLAGAAVVETIFNIPGIGQLIVTAISRRDYPVIQATVLVIALIYVVLNFVVDLLYPLLDPRIRLAAGGRR